MGQSLHRWVAGRRRHRLPDHANGAAVHRPHRRPHWRRLMLSALGLARAIEGGELTPTHAVELCADAIAKCESEVGAFVTLDIEAARKGALTPGLKSKPLRGLPV